MWTSSQTTVATIISVAPDDSVTDVTGSATLSVTNPEDINLVSITDLADGKIPATTKVSIRPVSNRQVETGVYLASSVSSSVLMAWTSQPPMTEYTSGQEDRDKRIQASGVWSGTKLHVLNWSSCQQAGC